MQILDSLIPIFAVIALGMALRQRSFLNADSTAAFNRFAYYLALPLFLFYKLATASATGTHANAMLFTLLSSVVLTAAVGVLAAHLSKVPSRSRGSVIQACFRGNLAFIGLPLVLFTIGDLPPEQRSGVEAAVLLTMTPVVLFYNVASVVALAAYNENTQQRFSIGQVTTGLFSNPLIWACAAGATFQIFRWPVPPPVLHICEIIGSSSFAIALIGIGSQLVSIPASKAWLGAILPTSVKCLVAPVICWTIGDAMGLTGVEFRAVVILSATPTAVSTFVLADQMNGDSDLAATTVVLCTAFSLVTLSAILMVT
jgi:predicted permease